MKAVALFKARERLEKARQSLQLVQSAANHKDFRFAWTDLLVSANAVFTILEQGAKTNPQSRQWFGNKKRFRTKDPLLSYMHQARNADEHGIEPTTMRIGGGGIRIGRVSGTVHFSTVVGDGEGGTVLGPISGDGEVDYKIIKPIFMLAIVKDDRFGNACYYPPIEHLGSPIVDTSPVGVGLLLLAYLDVLVQEASALKASA